MKLLREIAQVKACYPFRNRLEEVIGGDAKVVQMKDVQSGMKINWANLVRTNLDANREPNWLTSGDILFMARGSRNIAISLRDVPEKIVCSPLFFNIHINTKEILPEFLAWQINRTPSQNYFSRLRMGTRQLSVRKKDIEDLPIVIPPIEKQENIIELNNSILRERSLFKELNNRNEEMMNFLAINMTNEF